MGTDKAAGIAREHTALTAPSPMADMTIELHPLPLGALQALTAGDLRTASKISHLKLTPYFVSPEWDHLWRYRFGQVTENPQHADWITRAVFDKAADRVVGHAGYHGAPDGDGMIEVAYAIDPQYPQRGYAARTLGILLRRARDDARIRTVRATISPDNHVSQLLVTRAGFV